MLSDLTRFEGPSDLAKKKRKVNTGFLSLFFVAIIIISAAFAAGVMLTEAGYFQ